MIIFDKIFLVKYTYSKTIEVIAYFIQNSGIKKGKYIHLDTFPVSDYIFLAILILNVIYQVQQGIYHLVL